MTRKSLVEVFTLGYAPPGMLLEPTDISVSPSTKTYIACLIRISKSLQRVLGVILANTCRIRASFAYPSAGILLGFP